jgi:hypothetical protein
MAAYVGRLRSQALPSAGSRQRSLCRAPDIWLSTKM